ncbi:squalene monooxygenase-like [Protopterus annectens]|uniref:squalene monooxygenase-like n=1 Tax=Protopterus annectens TaxID=7888 RepID=UPI001CFBFD14|nr:squalene monooxygenase-like [Protopterus annectens]
MKKCNSRTKPALHDELSIVNEIKEIEVTTHRKEAGSPESISTDTFSNVASNDEADIIVVGAGVLGAAFAAVMARDGRKVMVVEKDMKEPDQFAGEVMQPGGFQMLKELGLADSMEGFDASPFTGYHMYDLDNKDNMHLHFPLGENKKVKEGRSFFHGRFAVGLRKLAMAEPKVRFIEGTVTRLLEEEGYVTGVLYKEKETGNNKTPPEWKTTKMTILTYETILVFFYQVSSTETRILINFIGQPPRNLKDYIMENIYPRTPEVLKDPLLTALQNEHLKIIPARYLPAVAVNKPGVLILGEAYNIRHPFTGGGMSVILNDIKIWRELLQDIPDLYDNEKIFQAKQKFYWLRKKSCSFVVNTLAEVLHRLFTASDETQLLVRKALFCYCNLSEQHALGPVLLTTVLAPKPLALIKTLSTVILYAMYLSIKSELWYAKPRGLCKSTVVLYNSLAALIPLIYSEIKQHNN